MTSRAAPDAATDAANPTTGAPTTGTPTTGTPTTGTRTTGTPTRATGRGSSGSRATKADPAADKGSAGVAGPAGVNGLAAVADLGALAGRVRDAVLAVPGVSGLAAGTGVEVATLFPGGKIVGIRLGNPVEVHVTVDPVPITPVATQIRAAVRGVLADLGQPPSVEVVVDDIDLPVAVDGS